ncbi:hypothetical protein B0H19DRAFT_1298531 [Mycena capillaripes]|nr:hypothetical protein B0H19DRAFT_1298531 [Mycena capillaripes]
MANPFNWDYSNAKSAFALFLKNDHNQQAFLLEIPNIDLKFTDGIPILAKRTKPLDREELSRMLGSECRVAPIINDVSGVGFRNIEFKRSSPRPRHSTSQDDNPSAAQCTRIGRQLKPDQMRDADEARTHFAPVLGVDAIDIEQFEMSDCILEEGRGFLLDCSAENDRCFDSMSGQQKFRNLGWAPESGDFTDDPLQLPGQFGISRIRNVKVSHEGHGISEGGKIDTLADGPRNGEGNRSREGPRK